LDLMYPKESNHGGVVLSWGHGVSDGACGSVAYLRQGHHTLQPGGPVNAHRNNTTMNFQLGTRSWSGEWSDSLKNASQVYLTQGLPYAVDSTSCLQPLMHPLPDDDNVDKLLTTACGGPAGCPMEKPPPDTICTQGPCWIPPGIPCVTATPGPNQATVPPCIVETKCMSLSGWGCTYKPQNPDGNQCVCADPVTAAPAAPGQTKKPNCSTCTIANDCISNNCCQSNCKTHCPSLISDLAAVCVSPLPKETCATCLAKKQPCFMPDTHSCWPGGTTPETCTDARFKWCTAAPDMTLPHQT
jgi:hypothetical protein